MRISVLRRSYKDCHCVGERCIVIGCQEGAKICRFHEAWSSTGNDHLARAP